MDADEHLVGADLRLVDISGLEDGGRAVRVLDDRIHGCTPLTIRCKVAGADCTV